MLRGHKDNSLIINDYILKLLRKGGLHCKIGTLDVNGITHLKSFRPIVPLKTNNKETIGEKIINYIYDGKPKHHQINRLQQTIESRTKRKTMKLPYGDMLPDIMDPKKFNLYHSRDEGEFPNNLKKPYFLYNWFSSYPFFDDSYSVLYQYEIISPINEMLVITKNHYDDVNIFKIFGSVIKKILALVNINIDYDKKKLFSDYAVAAFIVQIMKLNGLLIHDTFVILSKYAVDNFLKYTKIHKQINKVGKNKKETLPEGDNVYGIDTLDKGYAPIGFYSNELAEKIRNAILKKALEKRGGRKTKRKTKRKIKTKKIKKI
tara:strand:+ start:102 stop:1055 length:954 start_codon:yes stop_codon:yes gene_type:complete